jgi:hypothetical protein
VVVEVTQFEIVRSVEKISEQYLLPVLVQMLESLPFNIFGFHSDNGSEYVNRRVAELCKSYSLTLLNLDHVIQTTMHWLKAKTHQLSEKRLATSIFLRSAYQK